MSISSMMAHVETACEYAARSRDDNVRAMAEEIGQAFEELKRELRRLRRDIDDLEG